MDLLNINPRYREYVRERRLWEESLSQDRYTVKEAATALNISERKVRQLIKAGDLAATRVSERNTLIPKQAIVECMVPTPQWVRDFRKTLSHPLSRPFLDFDD